MAGFVIILNHLWGKKYPSWKWSKKTFLILENAPGYRNKLMRDDGQVIVASLPPNCTPLLQPMDQNIVQTIKLFYCKKLLLHILADEIRVITTIKNLNLRSSTYNLKFSQRWLLSLPPAFTLVSSALNMELTFLRNVGWLSMDCTSLYLWRHNSLRYAKFTLAEALPSLSPSLIQKHWSNLWST
jgi:hypothetical protein